MRTLLVLSLGLLACFRAAPEAQTAASRTVTLSVVATTDLHGHLESLPLLGGRLANLRRARAADGGGVLLVDAGDMFQGTLESNVGEGAAVVEAYNALGYAAVAIGNHELDFGPAGPATIPRGPGDDARGALKARAREARYPFLAANIVDRATGRPVDWPNIRSSTLVEVAGVKVGIVGVATLAVPTSTLTTNFRGLEMAPLAHAIAREAAVLRRSGAVVVVALVHAGGRCSSWDDPLDLSSCAADSELFDVLRVLPAGAVDVVAGGHSHGVVAHRIAGIPVVQAGANGAAFARVDLVIDTRGRRVAEARILPPEPLCRPGAEGCAAGPRYEGAEVAADPDIARIVEGAMARTRLVREERLGVVIEAAVTRAYDRESPLGNLIADLMLAAWPRADVAITNGGGLRADLPAGELTYGQLHEAHPFDNRFATVSMTAGQLRRLLAANLASGGGALLVAGVRVRARCEEGGLEVTLTRADGRLLAEGEALTVVTSDYLALGADRAFREVGLPPDAVTLDEGESIRDQIAGVLRGRGGRLRGDDPAIYDASRPRFDLPGERPLRCEK